MKKFKFVDQSLEDNLKYQDYLLEVQSKIDKLYKSRSKSQVKKAVFEFTQYSELPIIVAGKLQEEYPPKKKGFFGKTIERLKKIYSSVKEYIDAPADKPEIVKIDILPHIYSKRTKLCYEIKDGSSFYDVYPVDSMSAEMFWEHIEISKLEALSTFYSIALERIAREIAYSIKQKCQNTSFDKREKFRTIVKFLFKNLDDEHAIVFNNLNIKIKVLLNVITNEKTRNRHSYQ